MSNLTKKEFEEKYFPETIKKRKEGLLIKCPRCKGTGEIKND